METRLASQEDAVLFADVHAASFTHGAWSLAQISESLSLATTHALKATDQSHLMGFIMIQYVGSEAEVLTVCVAPAYRRRGIGRGLVEAGLAEARVRGVRDVFLEVAADNLEAASIYMKAGFQLTGKRASYYKRPEGQVDALTFGRSL